ncbi:CoA-binding protein [Zeaxanthinibacter enoshimensis]|uniref:CoA-binding protein n=1 Tax=Zeaxanthinibacter enoshimensis TaxID=392009 RepID=UPI003562D131
MNQKNTLVFGASVKPSRYSNIAIRRLVEKGIAVTAFGLREGIVAGVPVQTSLEGISGIHTVTLYMNPARQEAYYEDIIRLKPERVIFNPGTENPKFYKLLEQEGIEAEIACTLVLLSLSQF